MSIRATLDPYGGSTPMIDKLIGSAYPVVKSVADRLDEIHYLVANMEHISLVAGDLPAIRTVSTNIGSVTTVANNIEDIIAVAGEIPAIVAVSEHLDEIHTVFESLDDIGVVADNIETIEYVRDRLEFEDNADRAVSVGNFGAVGDGFADDTAALTAAVAAAYAKGTKLWWPAKIYKALGNIPLLHEVQHEGRGKIQIPNGGLGMTTDEVITATWEVEALNTATNRIYVSPTGSNTNDGLSTARPVQTLGRAFQIIENYGPTLFGQWDVKLAAGNYSGEASLTGIRSTKIIRVAGPVLTKTGDASAAVESPERHAYENPVPTAVLRHAQAGNLVAASGRCISLRDGVSLELKDVKIQGPWDIGFYASSFCNFVHRNVHVDLENPGNSAPSGGNTNPWRLGGRTGISIINFVRYTVYGGVTERAENGYYEVFQCTRNFDVLNESLRNAAGILIKHCGVGVKAKEGTSGHMDFLTAADCGTGVELQAWSCANMKGSNIFRCGAGIVLVNGEIHNEGGVEFQKGGAEDRYPDGVPILQFGQSSAIVGFGWEANFGNPALRDGYRPPQLIGSLYAPTLTGTVFSGTVEGSPNPNSQRIFYNICLAKNVFNIQGMRFKMRMVASFDAATLSGDVRFLPYASDVALKSVILPSGTVIPAGGATLICEWEAICVEDHGAYRVTLDAKLVTANSTLLTWFDVDEHEIDLTDVVHSMSIDTRILHASDSFKLDRVEVTG